MWGRPGGVEGRNVTEGEERLGHCGASRTEARLRRGGRVFTRCSTLTAQEPRRRRKTLLEATGIEPLPCGRNLRSLPNVWLS